MSELIPVKAYTRRKKVDLPPDPLSASFPSTRERMAKLRSDIRKAQQEPEMIAVLDYVEAVADRRQSIVGRFMPWFGRRG